MKILVIGSCNVDYTDYVESFPRPGETINGLDKRVAPGGKGLNQAIALKRAGADVTFFGAIGDDNDGAYIERVIKENGLDAVLLKKKATTGSATILVNKESENFIVINHGANYALTLDDVKEAKDLIESASIILLQGEIKRETNEGIIDYAHALGKVVVLNPAPAFSLPVSSLSKIDYLIPNEKEVVLLSDKKNKDEAVTFLLESGVKKVLVTLGEEGSEVSSKEGAVHVDAVKCKAIDTVAAGDTFIGYFLAFLSEGKKEEEAMRIASCASSIAVSRLGAISSIPYRDEVLSALRQ